MDFSQNLVFGNVWEQKEAQTRVIHLFFFLVVFRGLALIFPAVVKTEFCSAVGETL